MNLAQHFLEDALLQFQKTKALGDKTFAQLDEADFLKMLDAESNSIAIIIKHMHGNMLSRWTDFLTSDGEKEWRDRDSEFEETIETRDEVMKQWNEGWTCVLHALNSLQLEDFDKTI